MTSWGFTNGQLAPWNFGHPGWANERVSAHIISPVKDQLSCEVLAWTPGTNGTATAHAFELRIPDRPTTTELATYLDSVRADVKGRIVLAGRPTLVPVSLTARPTRRDDAQLRERYDPDRSAPPSRGSGPRTTPPPMSQAQISRQVDEFLVASGALLRINDAGRELGQIVAFSNSTYDVSRALPTVVMRNEDYGRVSRILAGGSAVELEFAIVNTVYPEGRTAYNAIAEIEGTDKQAEVVMLGGHLDSWQSATGATD